MKDIQIDQEVSDFLDSYTVDYPNEDEINDSIQYILSQVPLREKRISILKNRATTLLDNSMREMLMFGWLFWSLNGLFIFFGIVSLVQFKADPYLTLFTIAPLPFIVGLVEILKSRNAGLVELEMTLKYNAQQILISRLLVVGFYNFVINAAITVLCLQVNPQLLFTKLLLAWTIPYVFVTGIAFLAAMIMRGSVVSGALLTVWFVFCIVMMQTPEIQQFLIEMNGLSASAIIFAGVLIWMLDVIKINSLKVRSEHL